MVIVMFGIQPVLVLFDVGTMNFSPYMPISTYESHFSYLYHAISIGDYCLSTYHQTQTIKDINNTCLKL